MLSGLNTVDEILFVLNSAHPGATPLQKLDAADALLRRRFRHSYSYLRLDQNWLAASLRPIWDDLASPVRPDDILGHRLAACSQQSLVFMEIARRLGFDHAAVRAPGHFMAGVRIGERWWIYDANREVRARRYPLEWLQAGDARLAAIYQPDIASLLQLGARSHSITVGEVDAFAAPQTRFLHQVTDAISHFGWLAALTLWALLKGMVGGAHGARRVERGAA